MTGILFNKWYVSRLLFAVSRDDFQGTLHIMSRQIDKETGQTPSLKIAFYKASKKLHEIPEFNVPQLVGEAENPREVPASLWRKSNLVEATFTTAAKGSNPGLTATITGRWPDKRAIVFDVNPHDIGDRIGRRVLNEEGRFTFWSRGIKF